MFVLAWFVLMFIGSKYLLIKERGKAVLSVAVCAAAVLAVLLIQPRGLYVAFLDVGQADAAFIRTAQGGEYFIDGGRARRARMRWSILRYATVIRRTQLFCRTATPTIYRASLHFMRRGCWIRYIVRGRRWRRCARRCRTPRSCRCAQAIRYCWTSIHRLWYYIRIGIPSRDAQRMFACAAGDIFGFDRTVYGDITVRSRRRSSRTWTRSTSTRRASRFEIFVVSAAAVRIVTRIQRGQRRIQTPSGIRIPGDE